MEYSFQILYFVLAIVKYKIYCLISLLMATRKYPEKSFEKVN